MADKTRLVILTLRRCYEGTPPLTLRPPCLGTSKTPCEVMLCPLPLVCSIVRRWQRAYCGLRGLSLFSFRRQACKTLKA